MPSPTTPDPNQESVWDYPRPPAVEESNRRVRVLVDDCTIAETTDALRVLETSHPPVYYLPPSDVATTHLVREKRTTICEFKGRAVYFTVRGDDRRIPHAAWSYPAPTERYESLANHFAFYPSQVDQCYVDDEPVRTQDGDFYGGWVTNDIVGPFKGGPGTMNW